jgi:hypothetical protein
MSLKLNTPSGGSVTLTVADTVEHTTKVVAGKEELAGSTGSSLVGYQAAGTGAVARTSQDKMRESVSVKDFGAVGDGVADDTAAFTAAQAASEFVLVPPGMNCKVSAGLNYWQFFGKGGAFEPNRQWTLNPFPQTGGMSKTYVPRTFGIYENAAANSITANSTSAQRITNTQVLGTDAQGLSQVYTDRDHVAQYISSSSFAPDSINSNTTYTATTITNTEISALIVKPGMIIDTLHTIPCTGIAQSISGNTITVSAWYPATPLGANPITPANNTGAIINPNNKIFGQNIVVSAMGNGTTTGSQKFSGVELDLITPVSATPIPNTWGYDMAVLQGGYIDVGYQIRGQRNISYFSNNSGGAGLYGFRSIGDNRAVSVQDANIPIEVITNGQEVFGVSNAGLVSILAGAIKFIGPLQTTSTFVNLGDSWAAGSGALFYVTGYNVANGSEGKFLFAANATGTGQIYNSDGSGCTVAFQVSGRNLQIKATTGTFQFTAFQLRA